jgi:dTDP-4-dehydrorhamnose reductase
MVEVKERTGMKERLFISGVNGLLGQKVAQAALGRMEVFGGDVQKIGVVEEVVYERLDITDRTAVMGAMERIQPAGVVHTAAMTDVDRCEIERMQAWEVNVEGTRNVATACAQMGAWMVHLSTDYVFDGSAGPYGEDDPVHPLNYYGITKWESEKVIQACLADAVTVRTMVLYGWGIDTRLNFVTWVIQKLSEGQTMSVVTDQWGNPTYADDLAQALVDLLERRVSGCLHYAGWDYWTRHEMALEIARQMGVNADLLCSITTAELDQPAPRPLRSGLKTRKARALLGRTPRGFREGLGQVLRGMGKVC